MSLLYLHTLWHPLQNGEPKETTKAVAPRAESVPRPLRTANYEPVRDTSFLVARKIFQFVIAEWSKEQQRRVIDYVCLNDLTHRQHDKGINLAESFTKNLLSAKPKTEPGSDPLLLIHLISGFCRENHSEALFYDSREDMSVRNGVGHPDAFIHLFVEQTMLLRLKSLTGLCGITKCLSDQEECFHVADMNASITSGKTHPILEGVRRRLGRALRVGTDRINFCRVFKGSVCFEYTIEHLSWREKCNILKRDRNGLLRQNFDKFKELKLHPLMFRPAFDLAMFDVKGNKSFVNEKHTFDVGPSGLKKRYHQPSGWARYGLRVLTGIDSEDKWVHPFDTDANWWRAYHGTKNAGKYMEGVNESDELAMANAALDSISNIMEDGFNFAIRQQYGKGVYCSPDPVWMETSDTLPTASIRFEGETENRNFQFMLQVAVRPGKETLTPQSTESVWAVQIPDNIRPYGLLMREVKS
jgi:hypothetical protein